MEMKTLHRQQVISAKRFNLRPIQKSDEGALAQHFSDIRVAGMTREIAHPLPPGSVEALIERSMSDDHPEDIWVMDGCATGMGEVLGAVGLERMDRDQCEISFWVAPGLWGAGIASEAIRAVLDANPMACRTIFASVFQDNSAPARVLTNFGFKYIGDAEYFSVARGAQVPTWTYARKME